MSLENKYTSVENYLRKLSGQEKEIHAVDHNYVKAWSAHPDSHRTKPAKLLFMKGLQRYSHLLDNSSEEVDVVAVEQSISSPFDCPKAKISINECEKSLKFSFSDTEEKPDEVDEKLIHSFTPKQKRLYDEVMKLIDSERLAQLACVGMPNEVIKRRLSSEITANRLRSVFAEFYWDEELLGWLHNFLATECDKTTLASYFNILIALKRKVPNLVEKILLSHTSPSLDAVAQTVRKQMDPIVPILNQHKPRKLPGNPVLVICPTDPSQDISSSQSERMRFLRYMFLFMCKVVTIPVGKSSVTPEERVDDLLTSVRSKIIEIKNHYPDRPIILVGWLSGALIACHVALEESVSAIICLGFPLTGVNGSRGDLNDPLLDSKVPTLFVVGQNACMCSTDDVEDFRSRMRAETGLVVVGGADDFLRMNERIMTLEGVTQLMIDRCIVDEIGDFLLSIFVKMTSVSMTTTSLGEKLPSFIKESGANLPHADEGGKRKRKKPREYSPELSPVRKRAKHQLRQTPHNVSSARLSPTTSESSSSGSFTTEKLHVTKPGHEMSEAEKMKKLMETMIKKTSNKKMGRPATGTWRKRPSTKIVNHAEKDECYKKIPRELAEEPEAAAPAKPAKSKNIPFPVKILPKKNDPVDVEKAFGRDSSFLPRPLTPPEPEDTVSAEETEKALAELESMSGLPSSDSTAAPDLNSSATSVNQTVCSEQSFLPVSSSSDVSAVNSPPVVKSVCSSTDSKTSSISVTHGFQTVLQAGKINPSSLQNVKYMNSVSLIGNNQVVGGSPVIGNVSNVLGSSHASSATTSKSTVITLSSSNAATLLVSSPNVRAQPGKIIQLLSKGNLAVPPKSSSAVSGSESGDQQACNLSLLSDVAGMTQPIKDGSKKAECSTSATLVKLAASDRCPAQSVKCLKVKKMLRAPSPPVRVETPEELVEKQLAIQALNNSIGIESSSSIVKESGYSICYAKADGSIVSHAVTRPGFSYFTRPPLASAQSRGRGRSQLVKTKSFPFSEP